MYEKLTKSQLLTRYDALTSALEVLADEITDTLCSNHTPIAAVQYQALVVAQSVVTDSLMFVDIELEDRQREELEVTSGAGERSREVH